MHVFDEFAVRHATTYPKLQVPWDEFREPIFFDKAWRAHTNENENETALGKSETFPQTSHVYVGVYTLPVFEIKSAVVSVAVARGSVIPFASYLAPGQINVIFPSRG